MTASAVASLSMDPLQLLVCIGSQLPTCQAIVESGHFAVNVLGDGQQHLATRFATRRPDKFAGVGLRDDSDTPVLADAIAHFVCAVGGTLPGGDHTIVVGDVLACDHVPGTNPLVYFASSFGSLCDPAATPGTPSTGSSRRRCDCHATATRRSSCGPGCGLPPRTRTTSAARGCWPGWTRPASR